MKRPFLSTFIFAGALLAVQGYEGAAAADPGSYKTPLAGEACDIQCLGVKVAVPGRNRDNNIALVVGGALFSPSLAGTDFLPLAALYLKHRWDDVRFRGTFSLLVNDADISRTYAHFQLLGHLDNNTIPFAQSEINGTEDVPGTALKWGTVNGRIGGGYRYQVRPFQIDNDLRLQLFYQVGYLYTERVPETSPTAAIPADCLVHGPYFRLRYDGLRRNLMELPHQGFASGVTAEFMTRSHLSRDSSPEGTSRYAKVSGYFLSAMGIPYLSERNRLLLTFNGGTSPYGELDRFSAFRIGGGPIPSETDDLDRQVFPGALFGQFPVSDYFISSLEYRREMYPFLFLRLRGTYAWIDRETFTGKDPNFEWQDGSAVSVGLTTGFLWESEIDLDYSYDSMLLRNGHTGGAFSFLWSKSF